MNNIIEDILKGLYDLCPKGKQEIDFFKAREYLLSSLNKVIEERDKEIRKEVTKYVQEAIKDPKSDNYIYADMIPLARLDGILNRRVYKK